MSSEGCLLRKSITFNTFHCDDIDIDFRFAKSMAYSEPQLWMSLLSVVIDVLERLGSHIDFFNGHNNKISPKFPILHLFCHVYSSNG
jgi:hypothetical protein